MRILLCLSLIVLFIGNPAQGQNEKFKALFIYNFTKYIDWPSDYLNNDFVIGVYGSSPILTDLELIASKRKVGVQTIIVQQFNSVNDIGKCHVLYIPPNKSSSLADVIAKIGNEPTLIISDAPGLAHKGASINYVLRGTQQDFEINKRKIEASHLKINSALLSLGTVINK